MQLIECIVFFVVVMFLAAEAERVDANELPQVFVGLPQVVDVDSIETPSTILAQVNQYLAPIPQALSLCLDGSCGLMPISFIEMEHHASPMQTAKRVGGDRDGPLRRLLNRLRIRDRLLRNALFKNRGCGG